MSDTTIKVSPHARKIAEAIAERFRLPKRLVYDLAIEEFYEKTERGEIVITAVKESKGKYTVRRRDDNDEK